MALGIRVREVLHRAAETGGRDPQFVGIAGAVHAVEGGRRAVILVEAGPGQRQHLRRAVQASDGASDRIGPCRLPPHRQRDIGRAVDLDDLVAGLGRQGPAGAEMVRGDRRAAASR